jgi:hypothetical protein
MTRSVPKAKNSWIQNHRRYASKSGIERVHDIRRRNGGG